MKIILPKNKNTTNKPTNYILLSDSSGSMYGAISDLQDTISAVIDLMTDRDTITVGDFASWGDFDFFIRGLKKSKNIQDLVKKKIRARGCTCYTQALDAIPSIIQDVKDLTGNDNFSFYFLSDGYPNDRSSEKDILASCRKLKGKFSTAYICGFGGYYNRKILLDMAECIQGNMNHISDFQEMKVSYNQFVSSKKTKTNIKIDKKYDLVWQVTDTEINILTQNADHSVDVYDSDGTANLYAVDYSELETYDPKSDTSASFNYSLAYVLSQKNKANLGVALLRKAGAKDIAKMVQKSFTVTQKGTMENELKHLALVGGEVLQTLEVPALPLESFVEDITKNLGKVYLDLSKSKYRNTTKKAEDISAVKFEYDSGPAKIISVEGNENRPNINLLTVQTGKITKITDPELQKRVDDYNKANPTTPILLPITAPTFRNYSVISNGDFNFQSFTLVTDGVETVYSNPSAQIDIFDESTQTVNIGAFTKMYKQLIELKAHVSCCNFLLKKYGEASTAATDKRVAGWGLDGMSILDAMGLDKELRYAPKRGSTARKEDDDYIPFLEITASLAGASTINAKDSYAKWEKRNDKNPPKQNPGDAILWPLFESYEYNRAQLGADFIPYLESGLKGLEYKVDILKGKLSQMKFYLITTNSWFEGVDKSDQFTHDGVVVKVKETKEYV